MAWRQRGVEREQRQVKVFTKWVNTYLRTRKLEVRDLITDFSNGVMLCHLYECISDDKLPRFPKDPRKKMNHFQKINTLSNVIRRVNQFVREIGIGLQYGAEQIAKGDRVPILGLLWVLITKFVIPEPEEENTTAKRALLKWVQKVLEPYDNVDVKNFNRSFQDGLAFCALLHQFDSESIDYHKLTPENKRENCALSFSVADGLGIPQVLDPEDIVDVDRPDDKIVMTYVAMMYHYFKRHYKDKLGRKSKKFEHDVERLVGWIEKSMDQYLHCNFTCDAAAARLRLEELEEFYAKKKEYAKFKAKVNVLLSRVQREQKKKRLRIYVPDDRHALLRVEETWAKLNSTVSNYGKKLRKYISNLDNRRDLIVEEYDLAAAEFVEWCSDKQSALTNVERPPPAETEGEDAGFEDEDTDDDTRALRDAALELAEEKLHKILDKHHELREAGLEDRATVEKAEVVHAKAALLFALSGVLPEELEAIKGFRIVEVDGEAEGEGETAD